MVSREEFESLKLDVEVLRRRVEALDPAVDEHEDRLDAAERALDSLRESLVEARREVRALGAQVGRMADVCTTQGPVLDKVARQVARLVEILEPRSVVAEGK